MDNLIAVCNNHLAAVQAVGALKEQNHLTSKQLSIIGKADKARNAIILDDDDVSKVTTTEAGIGVALGSALGILTGVGIFAIPGLGFLYGAGALIGGIAGFDLGLIGGGIVSALTVAGIKINETHSYDEDIKQGKFLVVVQGTKEVVNAAKSTLEKMDGVE
ncbi:MAG: hypothetical protein KDC07_08360, partial [Chitinophagaceae bacterium]|nr:hypothetical protein [Chitinophagaceae bacterium]